MSSKINIEMIPASNGIFFYCEIQVNSLLIRYPANLFPQGKRGSVFPYCCKCACDTAWFTLQTKTEHYWLWHLYILHINTKSASILIAEIIKSIKRALYNMFLEHLSLAKLFVLNTGNHKRTPFQRCLYLAALNALVSFFSFTKDAAETEDSPGCQCYFYYD